MSDGPFLDPRPGKQLCMGSGSAKFRPAILERPPRQRLHLIHFFRRREGSLAPLHGFNDFTEILTFRAGDLVG